MRSPERAVGIRAASAAVLVAAVLAVTATGANPPAAKYKLPPQVLAKLPNALVLERVPRPLPGGIAPRGIQYFQSQGGLSGMYFQRSPSPPGNRLVFPLQGEWAFLPDKGFEQRDARGNRCLIYDGKSQVFDQAGLQVGALQDPGLHDLYGALLKLTM
ncbi:MAG TPA: hypothetical protein VMT19_07240 [Thermoanaerobaculaceae bacterium]|nr:hypothetical protein [Thermoanaerobaculaceae bacterium]